MLLVGGAEKSKSKFLALVATGFVSLVLWVACGLAGGGLLENESKSNYPNSLLLLEGMLCLEATAKSEKGSFSTFL